MDNDLVGAAFVRDTAAVTAICAEIGANGILLVCNRCGDIEAPIAGVLIIDDAEEAWVSCAALVFENCHSKERSSDLRRS